MSPSTRPGAAAPRLTRSGALRLVTVFAALIAQAALFFAAAGSLAWMRGWIYYGGLLAYLLAALPAMFFFFPGTVEVVNERGRFKPDVKAWDKAFAAGYSALLLILPLAGGAGVRWRLGPDIPFAVAPAALAVTVLAYMFTHWAMIVNRFAETGVRIQKDRQQEVISTGPYGIVRHPFYISTILANLAYPLAVGSPVAYIPALVMMGLFVWRTFREDETLKRELPGYAEYAARVRYRLVPGVW